MTPTRRLASGAVATVAVVALVTAAVLAWGDGLNVRVAGIRLTANDPWRPLAVGLVSVMAAIALAGSRASIASLRRAANTTVAAPTHVVAALALAVALVSLAFNSWTASGPDSFAYVSQAALWREGRLALAAPLAATAPWPEAVTTFAPFGYRAAPGGAAALVPITSPGLPLVMAGLQTVFGHAAAFVVTPACGALLVLLTFAIGRRVHSPAAGLVAAWLAATSPAVLFMLMWPMTDVPAAACTALLTWCLLRRTATSAFAAGLTASMALLLRPNLLLVVVAAGLWLVVDALWWRTLRAGRDDTASPSSGPRERTMVHDAVDLRRVLMFALACLPGAVALAWINTRWYGTAIASGYGSASSLLSIDRVGVNARQYTTWLLQSSPLVALGLILVAWWSARAGALPRSTALLFGAIAAAVGGLYLIYEPYSAWWYLRFLLPLWPVACVAAGVGLVEVASRHRAALGAVTLVTLAAGVAGVWFARTHDVFLIGERERRYADIAHLVDTMTDPRGVIITAEHAGTIRYYAGRETIRWEMLDAAWLDRTVAWLASQGRHPYVLIEDWEQPAFQGKFAAENRLGTLHYAAVFAWQSRRVPGWIWLYDPLRPDAPTATPDPDLGVRLRRVAPMSPRFTTP